MSEDIVRVLRIIEYKGPRSWVESTVASSVTGIKRLSPNRTITVATLGEFPEILEKETADAREEEDKETSRRQ